MTREEKIRSFIDVTRTGLEIGPSFAPICPKSAGYKVETIDRLSQDDLRKKYASHDVNIDAIEPVDYVWTGQSYRELTGKKYGWIIASHVIEHTPDLIGFLNSCDEVLEPDGVLSLAIPDKRFCFDYLREQSSLASVIDARGRTVYSPGMAAEYFLKACALNGGEWHETSAETLRYLHTPEQAIRSLNSARRLIDIHAWCFTPSGFRTIVTDLRRLGLIKLREIGFYETGGDEFFVALNGGSG